MVPRRKHTMALKDAKMSLSLAPLTKQTSQPHLPLYLSGEVLPLQLNVGKINEDINFMSLFVSMSMKSIYSNKIKSLKFFNEVIFPYIKTERSSKTFPQTITL